MSLSISQIIGAIPLTAVVFFWLGHTSRMPRLVGNGHGSSSDSNIRRAQLCFRNEPSFLGVLKINREPARLVSAQLYCPEARQDVGGPLVWDGANAASPHETTIDAGENRNLYVLAIRGGRPGGLFVYDDTCTTPLPNGITDFEIHIKDKLERRYKFGVFVRHNPNSTPDVVFKLTLRDRGRRFANGCRSIASAFGKQ
jgi:hypothetical protein